MSAETASRTSAPVATSTPALPTPNQGRGKDASGDADRVRVPVAGIGDGVAYESDEKRLSGRAPCVGFVFALAVAATAAPVPAASAAGGPRHPAITIVSNSDIAACKCVK